MLQKNILVVKKASHIPKNETASWQFFPAIKTRSYEIVLETLLALIFMLKKPLAFKEPRHSTQTSNNIVCNDNSTKKY